MHPTQSQADNNSEETVFVRLAHAVLLRAADWASEQAPPTMYQRRFEFVGTSEFHEPVIAIPNYDHWLQGHLEEIAVQPETHECVRTLWTSGVMRYLLPKDQRLTPSDQLTDEQIHTLAGHALYAITEILQRSNSFTEILQRSNSFQPTDELIYNTYVRYRDAWSATTHHHMAIVPLLNFRWESAEPLRLGARYELSPFTDQEKAWVWAVMDGFHESGLIPFHTYIQTVFKLAANWTELDPNRTDDQDQVVKEFTATDRAMLNGLRNVVTALRLRKLGDVAVTIYAEQSDEVPPLGGHASLRMLSGLWSDFQVRRHGSVYALDTGDISEVQYFVEALGSLDSRPNRAGLEVALRRFNQSYSREFYEDRLIDLAIAMESTLLAGLSDGKTDLKYRFVLYGAALLARRHPSEDVHVFLRAMYDARSSVVHSGKSLNQMNKKKELLGLDWRAFAQKCEDMTRAILAEYVRKLYQDPESTVVSVTRGLEAQIVQGLALISGDQVQAELRGDEPAP